jgi:hypothetical protein
MFLTDQELPLLVSAARQTLPIHNNVRHAAVLAMTVAPGLIPVHGCLNCMFGHVLTC